MGPPAQEAGGRPAREPDADDDPRDARSPEVQQGLEPVDPAWWMVAVQWHPEELTETPEDWDRRLFAAFAERVSREQLSSVG